jgi:uncharacterized protein with beta-barrel porin domain
VPHRFQICGFLKQVYAISDKAKDVRSVVTRLNTQRGEREQATVDLLAAASEAAPSIYARDQHAQQAQQQLAAQAAPWTDFLATQASCSCMRRVCVTGRSRMQQL